ncbi:hypothetical protein OG21DRAFT_1489391 [Imleria badia]|nr:hypothetical protein OG21DRAFT_1489391 [Imleria badia]
MTRESGRSDEFVTFFHILAKSLQRRWAYAHDRLQLALLSVLFTLYFLAAFAHAQRTGLLLEAAILFIAVAAAANLLLIDICAGTWLAQIRSHWTLFLSFGINVCEKYSDLEARVWLEAQDSQRSLDLRHSVRYSGATSRKAFLM